MEIDIRALLESNPLLLTFTVIGIGYLVGHIRVASVVLGDANNDLVVVPGYAA